MSKLIHWILTALLLTSSARMPTENVNPEVTRINPLDAHYPSLPLTPLSPRF